MQSKKMAIAILMVVIIIIAVPLLAFSRSASAGAGTRLMMVRLALTQILGREAANLGGRDLGQFFGDLVNEIEAAIEKHGVRERRGAADRDLELIVPIGSHLGDDAIQILLAWSFVDEFLDRRNRKPLRADLL